MKNAIQKLKDELCARIPGLEATIDAPDDPKGTWWLDLDFEGRSAVVEWRPRKGFGVSAPAQGEYGEGSDEFHPDLESALSRLVRVLKRGETTRPPRQVALRKLRESRHFSQEALARELEVKQATVSKLERRSDMYISTLRRVIKAMGGDLEIRARFPEGIVNISQFEDV
ncbi:MAG: XRE family transcriptional regulator [Candidatus Xenobia bacterium]